MEEKYTDHEKKSAISAAICSVILAVVTITSGAVDIIRDNHLFSILLVTAAIILFIVTSIICFGKREPEDNDKKHRYIKIICMGISLILIIVLVICTVQRIFNEDSVTIQIGIHGCGHGPTATPTPTPVPSVPSPSVKIAAGDNFSLLLKSDKTVSTYGRAEKIDTSDWENIVQIAAYKDHAVGLREDGSVVVTGASPDEYNVSGWREIIQVAACDEGVIGVMESGLVLLEGPCSNCLLDCGKWEDVDQIVGAGELIVAQMKNKDLMTVNEYKIEDKLHSDQYRRVVSGAAVNNWIVFVFDDGSIKTIGDGKEVEDVVSSWTDMKQVAGGNGFAVGLKNDGTVHKAGDSPKNPLDVTNWSDMVAVCAGGNHAIGLRADGTVFATGDNSDKQCDIVGESYWAGN